MNRNSLEIDSMNGRESGTAHGMLFCSPNRASYADSISRQSMWCFCWFFSHVWGEGVDSVTRKWKMTSRDILRNAQMLMFLHFIFGSGSGKVVFFVCESVWGSFVFGLKTYGCMYVHVFNCHTYNYSGHHYGCIRPPVCLLVYFAGFFSRFFRLFHFAEDTLYAPTMSHVVGESAVCVSMRIRILWHRTRDMGMRRNEEVVVVLGT